MSALLALTPFLEPLPDAQHWLWVLVLPMALGVALSYKAIRTKDLARYPRDVASMTLQIVAAVVGIAVGLHLLVVVLLPYLPAE